MKLVLPEYYKKFSCIAGKCKDTCCTGWGIYIDDKTAAMYKSIDGDFGRRLRCSIDFDDEQCFVTARDKRCPFLNESNLCDIILNLGEDKLCRICDRHPRYFEWFDDCIEGGLGLCCEEAAAIILSTDAYNTYETEADESLTEEADCDEEPLDEVFTEFLRSAREKIISLLSDKDTPLEAALDRISAYAALLQDMADCLDISSAPDISEAACAFDSEKASAVLNSLEPADSQQQTYLDRLCEYAKHNSNAFSADISHEDELRRIAVYFVYRYFMKSVFSGYIYPKLMLAVFGTRVISASFSCERSLGKELSFEDRCALAKLFSKTAEYSEDNLSEIYDNYDY